MDHELIIKIVTPAVTALAGAIIFLWRQVGNKAAATEKILHEKAKETELKLASCEDQHSEASKQIIELTGRVGRMEGRMEGVQGLSEAVLREIRNKCDQ